MAGTLPAVLTWRARQRFVATAQCHGADSPITKFRRLACWRHFRGYCAHHTVGLSALDAAGRCTRGSSAGSRHYDVTTEAGVVERYPSVTTVLGSASKPGMSLQFMD